MTEQQKNWDSGGQLSRKREKLQEPDLVGGQWFSVAAKYEGRSNLTLVGECRCLLHGDVSG